MENVVKKGVDATSNIGGKTADAAVSAGKGAVKAGEKAVDATVGAAKVAGDKAGGVAKNVGGKAADAATAAAFEKKFAGAKEVPIFSDPRIVPAFHNVGPAILATDAKDPAKMMIEVRSTIRRLIPSTAT